MKILSLNEIIEVHGGTEGEVSVVETALNQCNICLNDIQPIIQQALHFLGSESEVISQDIVNLIQKTHLSKH